MSPPKRRLLGVFIVPPFLIFAAIIGAFVLFFATISFNNGRLPGFIDPNFDGDRLTSYIFSVWIPLTLWAFAAWFFCVLHALRNPELDKDDRLLWVLAIVAGAVASPPLYWYSVIRAPGESVDETASAPSHILRRPEDWPTAGKLPLGFAAAWPIVNIILFVFSFVLILTAVLLSILGVPGDIVNGIGNLLNPSTLMGLLPLSIVSGYFLGIILLGHANTNPRLDKSDRFSWTLIFLLAGFAANSYYWYLYIWKRENRLTE